MAAKKLTITKVWNPHAKIGAANATFDSNGEAKPLPYTIKWWVSAPYNADIVVGAVLDVDVEKKPSDRNPEEFEHWVKTVDGKGDKPKGGGGGRAFTPKTREEIHSPQVAEIVCACIAKGATAAEAASWLKLYDEACSRYKGAVTAGVQGAS